MYKRGDVISNAVSLTMGPSGFPPAHRLGADSYFFHQLRVGQAPQKHGYLTLHPIYRTLNSNLTADSEPGRTDYGYDYHAKSG